MIKNSTNQVKKLVSLIVISELVFWVLFILINKGGLVGQSNGNSYLGFQEPEQLNWFWILIPLIGVYLYNAYRNQQIYDKAGKIVQKTIFKPIASSKTFISFLLFRTAIAFLIIALAQPAFGKKKVKGTTKSMELVVCLDVSNSMNTMDVSDQISRLGIAKRAINELINRLGGEKIGISVFANEAFTQLPLTLDYYAAKMFVNEIETDILTNQGTNIKAALENAYAVFSKDEKMSKAVLLITDGENHDEDPSKILQQYKDEDILLAVIGVGTQKGGLVPAKAGTTEMGYKKNAVGMPVHSKLNVSFLESIAEQGGGVVYISENAFPDLRAVTRKVSSLKRTTTTTNDFEVLEQRYQIPLIISILCFIAYLLWSNLYFNRMISKK